MKARGQRVFVVGVGMTKFEKPGGRGARGTDHESRREGWDYPQMAKESGTKALDDAGIDYAEVEQGFVGYCTGDSTSGNRALYELGMTGIPVVNVNNNCSTGSTALFLAAQTIRGGLADCTIALGFEKMQPGSLGGGADDRESPMKRHILALNEIDEMQFPVAPWMFGAAGREHMKKYGTTAEHFAKIGYKNHKHSVNNPYAQFQDEYTLDDILGSRMISDPLTKLQCSPTSDGSGAAILAGEEFVDRHGLTDRAVEIVGQAMTTDFASTFDGSARNLIGYDMNVQAAQQVYEQSGLGPADFQVIELHDCFSANELLLYEALGLCAAGEAPELIDNEDTTYGGRWVVNPSGGLISKGHPLGATGLAQCAELTWQLRGSADKRQVDNVSAALQHNIGLGGAAVVTAYQRANR
jgi:acetyl-CoA acyltransferase